MSSNPDATTFGTTHAHYAATIVLYVAPMKGRLVVNDTTSKSTNSHNPRIVILSLRNIYGNDLYRCPLYEFEDLIAEIDHADLIAPRSDPGSRRNQWAKRLAFHAPITLKASLQKLRVDKRYDLFLAVCGSPRDLLMVDAARHIKDACAYKVCVMDELWIKEMHSHRHFTEILKQFDLVALYYSQSVEPVSKQIDRKCIFLPPGIDSIRFCPYPDKPARVVDIYSVGRRSSTTHREILKVAKELNMFYLHDSIEGTKAIDPSEHRALFANIAKRSKYFIVNPGLVDRPEKRGNQSEIGNRYFEGAAAGAVMIGDVPSNGEYERLFDWSDAVIHLPYGSDKIGSLIRELERQPDRREQIQRLNISNALTRHDWVYRWEEILKQVGLEPTQELTQRKLRLAMQAKAIMCS